MSKKKKKNKPQPARHSTTVAVQPAPPPGTYATQDDATAAGRRLMTDLEALFKKHKLGATLGGCLIPIVRWGEVPEGTAGAMRKAWMISGVLAVKMTSKAMDPDAPTMLGLLNGAATRIYGPPSSTSVDVRPQVTPDSGS